MDIVTAVRVQQILEINSIPAESSILKISRDPYRTTTRYAPIDHLAVIESLNRRGWFIESYAQIRPHKKERGGFVRWSAVYRNPTFSPLGSEAIPMVIHQGSHDGSKPLTLSLAVRRLANQTTCVVGSCTYPDFIYKHIGVIPNVPQLDFEIEKALLTAGPVFEDINRMRSMKLNLAQSLRLAAACTYTRFDKDLYYVDINQLVDPSASNLWEQFNFIQDALIQAKWLRVQALGALKPRKAKAIKNIETSLKLRQALWNITVQHLQIVERENETPLDSCSHC